VNWLLSWLIQSLAVWLTAAVLPGFELRGGVIGAVRVAALLGVLQFFLGWLIFVVIGVGTLGIGFLLAFITRWIVSAILLKLTDSLSSSLKIVSFGRALIGALLMSGIGTAAEALLTRR
jgi:putative membrane protein